MTEDEIRKATPEQLRAMIAGRLGWQRADTPGGHTFWRPPGGDYGSPLLTWPDDIAQAWELDGENWLWEFGEAEDVLGVGVVARGAVSVFEPWRETKARTYATARCRAWLLAKLEEGEDERIAE